jgi:23S rRNA pseudouridine955/2504/2580 synthase
MTHNKLYNRAQHLQVSAEHAGRRIDNFLIGQLKGIPKTRIYQMLRKGEVRVNSSRIKQDYRLQMGDDIRIPPLFTKDDKNDQQIPAFLQQLLDKSVLYEDDDLLVLNKPAGITVHGGTNQKYGIIESLRLQKPDINFLELVHRLDKETSGCLLIAKDHRVLRALHNNLRSGKIEKHYLTLLQNRLKKIYLEVNLPLKKNRLISKERIVQVNENGKHAITKFFVKKYYSNTSLVKVQLITGRTHQIRVHAAQVGHPIAGDTKYGDRNFNKEMRRIGLKRLFLHAESIKFIAPTSGRLIKINAPLADKLTDILDNL